MKGDIRVTSKPDRGSNFIIAFPVAVAREIDSIVNTNDEVKDVGALSGKSYLLLDDIPENTFILASTLKKYGVKSTACQSGLQALELYTKSPGSFDCIITDLRMPLMSGQAFIVAIRKFEHEKERSPVPILVLSAESSTEEKRLCMTQYGADQFLLKPVKLRDLVSALAVMHSGKGRRVLSRRILVVDDDVIGAQFMSTVLTRGGHSCMLAHGIAEAVGELEKNQEHPFDVIMLDSLLGDGTGADFLRSLVNLVSERKVRKTPKVISVSGNTVTEQARLYSGYSVDGFIQKPARKQDVLEMVQII